MLKLDNDCRQSFSEIETKDECSSLDSLEELVLAQDRAETVDLGVLSLRMPRLQVRYFRFFVFVLFISTTFALLL